jgi:hypothetical protein
MNEDIRGFNYLFVVLITISSINQWTDLPIGNTFMWWVIYAWVLGSFVAAKSRFYDKDNDTHIIFLKLFLFWNCVCIVRGAFVAENYWEFKNLGNVGFVLLLPTSIFITTNKDLVQRLITVWFTYALPLFFILIFFFNDGIAYGRYLVPISFLAMFFPLLPLKWRAFVIIASILIMVSALNARSNVIKYGVSLCFGAAYLVKDYLPVRLLGLARTALLTLPFIFFGLAVFNVFNVYKMDEYLGGEVMIDVGSDNGLVEEDLTEDTRTDLYKEVIASAIKHNYVLLGRTPARGNDSELFGDYSIEVLKIDKKERFSNEVSILNIFTWTGIVGGVCYFLVFFWASHLALYRSDSFLMKIIGLAVAFRWLYAWVEDFSEFDLSYFFLWIMIGMCFSKGFREMTDLDFKYWVWGIFDKKYREIYVIESSDQDTITDKKPT